ncbi:MAG TPA: thiamine pyrophosphate-binding protein [Candidatus Binatia bacterium]|nr:thiamine pyrophosphate-binding protein [Candidatus Binatia bacterium]
MSEITGGEVLARCLASEGIRFVFGLPCPEVDPLLASLEAHEIRLVPVRHEAAAVHMAEGLYKTTGAVAAVLGNPGPGSANLLPGVITARHEGVPVLVVTAQHRLGIVYPSPPSTFQGQDQLDVFRPAVKWGGPILDWARIPEVAAMAFREMWCGRPGPVHLEIPAPVLYATGDEREARVLPPERYRAAAPRPGAEQIREAAAMIAAAKHPVLFAGSGVDRAGANGAVREIAELLGCPVITSMAGRAAFPADHPQRLHGYGPGADMARREADVLCVLGSRLGNLDLPYDEYWGDGTKQKLVQIDVDPRNMGVTRPLALGIVADLAFAARELAAALREAGAKRCDARDVERYCAADRRWRETQLAAVAAWAGPGIHPAHAMAAIGEAFGPDAVYVTDGGNTSLWAHGGLPATRPRSYHSILELGMLGTGIPSAIGAKLGAPDRDVVCVTGDGAAGFNFMEMQSAARERVKITAIVFAEGSWTMEEPNERMLYGRTFGTAMGTVRWDKVGEGLGCSAWYVEKLEDLPPALAGARAADGPAVICLRTDRDANLQLPPDMIMRFVAVYQGPGR